MKYLNKKNKKKENGKKRGCTSKNLEQRKEGIRGPLEYLIEKRITFRDKRGTRFLGLVAAST